jgi:DMSO/TMAO reductase YedYZ heme-binding membrane subunit
MQRRWPLALGLVAGFLALQAGLQSGEEIAESWRLATRWTARTGFFLLILTYSASSLYRLWPNGMTKALLRDRRWWGLGFAGSHTIHLFAFVTFFRMTGEAIPTPVLIGGGLGYVLLYAMALTSNRAGMKALGRNWKRLHSFGIHYIWLIFALDYISRSFEPETRAMDLAFSAIALGALGLRIATRRKSRRA